MQAINVTRLERTQDDARIELATAVLVGVVVAALWAAGYLGWVLLTEPAAVEQMVAWIG